MPLIDICDELAGNYPKGFKFTGWHPNCRCHTETILLGGADFEDFIKAKREGRAYDITKARGYVAEPPAAFKAWVKGNAGRIAAAAKAGTTPYFVKDNIIQVEKALSKKDFIKYRCAQYEALKQNALYKNVQFNEKNGGISATHQGHNLDPRGGRYEQIAQRCGFLRGSSVVLEEGRCDEYGVKKCEGFWDHLPFEVAGAETGGGNNIRNALKHCASKPSCQVAVVVLPNSYTTENLIEGIKKYEGLKNTTQFVDFKKIYFINKDSEIIMKKG